MRDPGVADDCNDLGGPIFLFKDRIPGFEHAQFHRAVCSQGSESVRQQALSLMLDRARQDGRLSPRAYRALCQIVSRARWRFRYHFEQLALLAYFTAGDASNLHRDIKALIELGYVARLLVPRRGGGKPTSYLTPICNAQDRSGETRVLLDHAARSHTGEQPTRHHDVLQSVTMTDGDEAKSSSRRAATRQGDDHIVDINCRKKKEGHDDIEFVEGAIVLHNGERRRWVSEFGSDRRLDAALAQAAGRIKSHIPLAGQVREQLGFQLGQKLDADARAERRERRAPFTQIRGSPTKAPYSFSTHTVHDRQDTTNDPRRYKSDEPEFAGEIARLRHEGSSDAETIAARGWVKLKPSDAEQARVWASKAQTTGASLVGSAAHA